MKSTQLPLIKLIVDQMISEARSVRKSTNVDPIPVIQRVASTLQGIKYVQIVTSVGIVSVRDDGKLKEPDYPILDIGVTDNWSKVSSGVIVPKQGVEVPFQRAANVAVFADEELGIVEQLLSTNSALPPVSVIAHPGSTIVFTAAEGTSLVWAYDPTATDPAKSGGFKNLKSEWTKNPLQCDDSYGIVRGWHRAVAGVFPRDKETGQPTKIDGVAVAPIGTRTGLRIVSRELGIVATLALSHLPPQWAEVSYQDANGVTVTVICDECGKYIRKQVKEKDMNIKMIDIGQIKAQPQDSTPTPAAQPPSPVIPAQPTPQTVTEEPTTATITAEKPDEQPTQAPAKAPEPAKTVDELFVELFKQQAELDEITKAIKATMKAIQKAYKAEVKDLKSNAKGNEELAKLRAAHKRLRDLLDADI